MKEKYRVVATLYFLYLIFIGTVARVPTKKPFVEPKFADNETGEIKYAILSELKYVCFARYVTDNQQ